MSGAEHRLTGSIDFQAARPHSGEHGVRGFRSVLLSILLRVFPCLDRLVPKDDRLVVFAQARGTFSDNSRAFFEYLASGQSYFTPVWLSSGAEQDRAVRAAAPGATVLGRTTLGGYRAALRARTVVASHGLSDLYPYSLRSGRKTVLLLWHAISFKRTSVINSGWSHSQVEQYLRDTVPLVSLLVASSDVDRYSKAASHGIDARKVIVTGLPRNDTLFRENGKRNLPAVLSVPPGRRVILYAPTWREKGSVVLFPFEDLDLPALTALLSEHDAYLLIRPHRNDAENIARASRWAAERSGRIRLAGPDVVADAADLLPATDVVLTDFSSIYLDTIALDKPVVFIADDLHRFEEERGLLYPYDLVAPGPQVRTFRELLDALDDALEGAPLFRERRTWTTKLFHAFTDGDASRRIAEFLKLHNSAVA